MPELRPRPRCVRAIGRRRGRCNPAIRPIPVRFADDSPVEGMGFEPSVPPRLGAFTPSKTSMSGSVGVGGFEKGEFEGNSATEKVAAQIGVRGPIRSNSARRKSFSGLPALSNGSLDRAGFRRSQKTPPGMGALAGRGIAPSPRARPLAPGTMLFATIRRSSRRSATEFRCGDASTR